MAKLKKPTEANTQITGYTHCSAFPGWLVFYFECGHGTVAEGLPVAMCQLCKNERDLQ